MPPSIGLAEPNVNNTADHFTTCQLPQTDLPRFYTDPSPSGTPSCHFDLPNSGVRVTVLYVIGASFKTQNMKQQFVTNTGLKY